MFFYRDTLLEDLPSICLLPQNEEELFYMFPSATFPLQVKQMKEIYQKREGHTTFLYDNEIIGYANLYRLEDDDTPYIGHLILSKNYRGKGFGKEIIRIMIRKAYLLYKSDKIKIAVINENTHAFLLYTKLGFYPFKASLRFDKKREQKVLISMQMELFEEVNSNTQESIPSFFSAKKY